MSLNIGIAGLGTVGAGVCKILANNAELLAKRSGEVISVTAISARNKAQDRGFNADGITWYNDACDMASDDNLDVIVEVIGGSDGIAYDLCKAALENGKHVVTANKALIAIHGFELAKIAEKKGVALLFEAAVAGGIPILKALREGLAANNFSRICGIMNGTCNYILSAMAKEKRDFTDVLAEAQALGYAETPPDLDIDGIDTAHKLSIITSIAYGCPVNFDAIHIGGIRNVSLADIEYADDLGYAIRLLGITSAEKNGVKQRVHACLVPKESPLGGINGALNAVLVNSDSLGEALFTGAGAGAGPTSSSVIADIIDIAAGRTSAPFGIKTSKLEAAKSIGIESHEGEYYIRLLVKDESGVLASITALFSKESIGVEGVLQKAFETGKTAQIALTTHKTNEVSIKKALTNIGEMDYVLEAPHMIRIEKGE